MIPATLNLGRARQALAEVDSLPDVTKLIDMAEVCRVLARKQANGVEAINDWAEFKIDAERKAGRWLAEMRESGERAGRGAPSKKGHDVPLLRDLDVHPKQSSRWQQLATVPERMYREWVTERNAKREEVTTHGVINLARTVARAKRRAEVAEVAEQVIADPEVESVYPVLYVDPPWSYDSPPDQSRSLENQYPTLSVEEIASLPVPAGDDAVLFCWATAPLIREALYVVEAWGFEYKTQLVWVKDRPGMGYYVRGQHELLLIGRRGDLPLPEAEIRPSSVIHAPRLEHSAKPPEVYDLIETMYPGLPGVELFARGEREGWARWGKEAPA